MLRDIRKTEVQVGGYTEAARTETYCVDEYIVVL